MKKEYMPNTVRELAQIEARLREGLISGVMLAFVEKGDTFEVGGKQYTVVARTKPRKKEYNDEIGGKNYEGNYTTTTIRIKDNSGRIYSAELLEHWKQNGKTKVSQWLSKGCTRKSGPWGQLSRDIEGDVAMDLINENNPFHEPSDSYKIIQKALDGYIGGEDG